jgi:hypothetical protein
LSRGEDDADDAAPLARRFSIVSLGIARSRTHHHAARRRPLEHRWSSIRRTALIGRAPAQRWLDADPKNVVCIHCKAGKGRSGVMACCLLLRTGDADSAAAAMALYDSKRVLDSRGLTVTSQRKYVRLYRMT